jgi:hypothetical protein
MSGGSPKRQNVATNVLAKILKPRKRIAILTRVFRATVPVGKTRAIERARLTRLIQKTAKYNATFKMPELATLIGVIDAAEHERINEVHGLDNKVVPCVPNVSRKIVASATSASAIAAAT